jgi:hypothetical protein
LYAAGHPDDALVGEAGSGVGVSRLWEVAVQADAFESAYQWDLVPLAEVREESRECVELPTPAEPLHAAESCESDEFDADAVRIRTPGVPRYEGGVWACADVAITVDDVVGAVACALPLPECFDASDVLHARMIVRLRIVQDNAYGVVTAVRLALVVAVDVRVGNAH